MFTKKPFVSLDTEEIPKYNDGSNEYINVGKQLILFFK